MKRQLIFFHGGDGQGDYETDGKMVDSLKLKLGSAYSVHYPLLSKAEEPDFGRRKQIAREIEKMGDGAIIVAHSLALRCLLACLSENKIDQTIAGAFLIATPFWHGEEDWVKPLKLRSDFAMKLTKQLPLFFYHCVDDDEVPIAHFNTYRQELPWATFRELQTGGHQLGNDLNVVANDILKLKVL